MTATGGSGDLGSTEEDVMMEDLGEGRPHLNRPPDGRVSWVQKVTGGWKGSAPRPENVLDNAFVEERMALEYPDGLDGEPVITIGEEVLKAMNDLWKKCIIVKVLGRSVTMAAMDRKLRELWKPVGRMTVMDLPRHFYLVRFERDDEYLSALTGGPWRVFGSYLMVQRWTPEFDATRDEIRTTPVWVRLLNLPVNFYHQAILMGIGKGVGKPVKVDLTTLNVERARFARICVEVDLAKPLKGTVRVNGERYFVAYEGMTNICSGCGIYGHLIHKCPRKRTEQTIGNEKVSTVTESATSAGHADKPIDEFTVVRRQGRRSSSSETEAGRRGSESGDSKSRNLREITVNAVTESVGIANKFADLTDVTDSMDIRDSAITTGENKENEDSLDSGPKESRVAEAKIQMKFGQEGTDNIINRAGPNEQRSNGLKHVKNGLRGKSKKQAQPTTGLIFGPAHEAVVRSESGKRLRMDQGSQSLPFNSQLSKVEKQRDEEQRADLGPKLLAVEFSQKEFEEVERVSIISK